MSNRYTPKEITEMAVGSKKKDKRADIDLDGEITTADARTLARINAGLEAPKAPVYTQNTDMSEKILDKILNSPEYTYDINADPLYKHYKNLYEKQGKAAAEDVYGLASASTGGYGNSYAATIAEKAYENYLDKLSGKAEELENNAYKRNMDQIESLYKQLSAAADYEDRSYSRFRDDVADYYKDTDNYREKQQTAFNNAMKKAETGDYSGLEELGIDTSALKDGDKRKLAELKAEYSDYSGLEELGIDTSALKEKEKRELAELKAKYSDYSGLKALGINTAKLSEQDLLDMAKIFASYGDYSLLERLGAKTQSQKERDQLEKNLLKARYYNYYK